MADVSVPDQVIILDPLRAWRSRFGESRLETVLRLLPTLAYMGLIFAVSAMPGRSLPSVVDDRIAHFVEYLILGVLLMFTAAGFATRVVSVRHAIASAAVAILYAASDEFHQHFTPGREVSVKDLGFDVLGAGSAIAMIFSLVRRRDL